MAETPAENPAEVDQMTAPVFVLTTTRASRSR
jgi:hypothetical protein